MNLLKSVSDCSYLVLAFRMRTSAPSRAILVRRFTRTETPTAWPFFRAQAPLQLHIICNNKRKEDFYAKILQERIFHNLNQHQMVAPIDHLPLHLPQSPLLLRPPHRLLTHRHWILHANQQFQQIPLFPWWNCLYWKKETPHLLTINFLAPMRGDYRQN